MLSLTFFSEDLMFTTFPCLKCSPNVLSRGIRVLWIKPANIFQFGIYTLSLDWKWKGLGHFTYKSAHRKSISRACGFTAQVLRLQCYISLSWIEHPICEPEPSRCTRSPIQLNRAIFEVQNVHYSWASLKIIFTWKNSYLYEDFIQPNSNFSEAQEYKAI